MNFAEPSEEREENGPNTDEEDDGEDENLPVLERAIPQEGPVLSVRLGGEGESETVNVGPNPTHRAQPVIAQHQRKQEPQYQPTTEERSIEVRNFRWRLTVVFCIQSKSSAHEPHKDPRMSD